MILRERTLLAGIRYNTTVDDRCINVSIDQNNTAKKVDTNTDNNIPDNIYGVDECRKMPSGCKPSEQAKFPMNRCCWTPRYS